MANEILKSVNSQLFDQLASQGKIAPDTYERVKSQIAPMTEMSPDQAQQMSLMSSEQMQATEPAPEPKVEIPEYAGTPRDANWVAPFSPEGRKQEIEKAVASGDFDAAEKMSKELEHVVDYENSAKIAAQNEKMGHYEKEKARVEAYNQRAQKLGLSTIAAPSPEAYGIAKQDLPATPEDVERSKQPTVAEVETAAAPMRQQAAVMTAAVKEQDRQVANAMKKEQDIKAKQEALEQAEKAKMQQEEDELNNPYGKTWGDRLRIALAVGLGSLGKENPALKMIEAKQKNIQENRKLSAEQKLARQKMDLDQAKFELDKASAMTDSEFKRAQIAKLYSEVDKQANEKAAQLRFALRAKDPEGFTPEEFQGLDPKMQESFVALPNGNFAKAIDPDRARNLTKYMSETGTIVPELMDLRSKIGSKDFSKLSFQDRAEVQNRLSTLVGALRIPITGPGPMTDPERVFILNTIGDPSKIFTLPGVQLSKLNATINTIEGRVRNQYHQAGVKLPWSQNERNEKIAELKSLQEPTVPKEVLRTIVNKHKK